MYYDIINYFQNNVLSDQVVFIDYLNINVGDIGPNERVDTLVNLYKQLRNRCLSSSYTIFYYVDPKDVSEFNNKLMNFSDIDMPGYDLVYGPSSDMKKITIERALKRSWEWSQIESLGTKKLEKTIAFFDIKKYTKFVNKNIERPLWVVGQLNLFHEKLINIIYDNEGSVNDIKGDEVMAVFEGGGQVKNAIESAFTILDSPPHMEGGIHIGIQTGIVIEATLGTAKFHKLTQIGEAVNIAARICSPKEDADKELPVNRIHVGEETNIRLEKELYSSSESGSISCGDKDIKVYTISRK